MTSSFKVGAVVQNHYPHASQYIRTLLPLQFGAETKHFSLLMLNGTSTGIGLDLLVLSRFQVADSSLQGLIQRVRRSGGTILVDCDDALLDVGGLASRQPNISLRDHLLRVEQLKAGLLTADFVVAATPALAVYLQNHLRRPVFTSVTHLDTATWSTPLRRRLDGDNSSPARLVYFGTPTHDGDLDILLRSHARINQNREYPVKLVIIGAPTIRSINRANVAVVEVPKDCQPYPQFADFLSKMTQIGDIGVAPLANSLFNAHKSDLKILEYTALGLPSIASNVGQYPLTVSHQVNGWLVEACEEAWTEAIQRVLNNRDESLAVAIEARSALSKRMSQTNNPLLGYIQKILHKEVRPSSRLEVAKAASHFSLPLKTPQLLEFLSDELGEACERESQMENQLAAALKQRDEICKQMEAAQFEITRLRSRLGVKVALRTASLFAPVYSPFKKSVARASLLLKFVFLRSVSPSHPHDFKEASIAHPIDVEAQRQCRKEEIFSPRSRVDSETFEEAEIAFQWPLAGQVRSVRYLRNQIPGRQ